MNKKVFVVYENFKVVKNVNKYINTTVGEYEISVHSLENYKTFIDNQDIDAKRPVLVFENKQNAEDFISKQQSKAKVEISVDLLNSEGIYDVYQEKTILSWHSVESRETSLDDGRCNIDGEIFYIEEYTSEQPELE